MPTPSLILVPARFKTGKLYTPVATTSGGVVLGASGDFNVTRATTATRFNSAGLIESVASGVPRLDYYTSGGTAGCPALLVEPSAANGILNSADTTTSWTLGANLSSGYVDVIGVSGNNLTVAVSGSNIGANAGRHSRGANGVSLASGSTYTISFLMKKTGTHTIGAYYAVIGSQDISSGFDVSGSFSSGSIYNPNNATNRIRRVERFGTDVFRCSETFTMTASATLTNFHFAPVVAVTNGTNSASGTTMAFAAPQIELGAIPTSFIPTNTAAVTRNADVINLSGAVSGCIGQTEGTLYAEVDIRAFANLGVFLSISNGGGNDRIEIYKNTDSKIYFDRVSATQGGGSTTVSSNALTAGIFKVAVAYKSGDTTMYINGTQIGTTQTQTFTFLPITKITIGTNRADISQFIDRIRAAALYTTRLTNAQLAALTTL